MKKLITGIFIFFILPAMVLAGFHFGLIKATKKKVEKVDEKVEIKKAEISELNKNHAPTLSWTGEPNYVSDGLDPETGTSTMTFTFRVKYTDADNDTPASGYPKVHIKKGGSEISGSPFTMNFVSGGYSGGAIYSYNALLSAGDYVYYFEAKDFKDSSATGVPTSQFSAPHISGWLIQTLDYVNVIAGGGGTSLKLDSNGHPHISYYGPDVNSRLKYAKWTGTLWSTETIKSISGTWGNTSLALDSANYPHISYKGENLEYAKWTGVSWSTQTVENVSGDWSAIVMVGGTSPRIAYSGNGLKYAVWSTVWSTQTVDMDISSRISLRIDSIGNPHIVYYCGGAKYAKWDGVKWSTQTIVETYGYDPSFTLDSSNNPHVAYSTNTNGRYLSYAKWNGSWQMEEVDILASNKFIRYSSIMLDSYGYPQIVYYNDNTDANIKGLRYAKWNGSNWQIETILPGHEIAVGISLVINSGDIPHISCVADGYLKYIKWNP